ncbi:MAG TPA: hypothetical protein PKA28_02825 [Methylomusa anaerophila]|uniref:Uncharacterized protein n=1 Tax=Methylomusa anaerophila TaxID=1930071 RepID=A0A348ANY8_9FIRM|nr:hypothetical protein [Methylomusa anaerophila]BBB92786.1 hypothetical protein MAMMFC1_03487 [Methylomusa anaerophila]HML87363.1 hypothetical protein [Methylomusa anaerophila]
MEIMDVLIPLLLMVLLYVVPELLKRRKTKEYEYPDIPDTPDTKIPPEMANTPTPIHKMEQVNQEEPVGDLSAYASHPFAAANNMPPPVNIPQVREVISPWREKLTSQTIANGIIFAEILLPPRAYRPIYPRKNTKGK